MYIPKAFSVDESTALELIPRHPLATLIRTSDAGLLVDHLPLILIRKSATRSILQGHVARANPLAREALAGPDVLAVFQGPSAYISPAWYATKKEDARVVPTWNYAVTHIRGTLRAMDDPAWLGRHLERLTAQQEAVRSDPWRVSDAPSEYLDRLQQNILGIEIEVAEVTGKIKASQNQPLANRESVIRGLEATDQGRPMAALVASLID